MIMHIDITGVGAYALDDSTRKYIRKKVGLLDRFVPRHARKTITADVKVAEVNREKGNKYEVEVIVDLPGKRVTAKDSTLNAFAAVDIVEAKLATQLRRYKEEHLPHVGNRKLLARFKRSFAREQQAV
jgi:putative sigma-54 modulation protein